jgi:RimJ/RimL family protein N-acetyltransferase
VPPHRQIDADGRPTVGDVAVGIRAELGDTGPGVLAVERKDTGQAIGYCGLVFHGNGAADEPELAFELLKEAHGQGYATEAGRAVVGWAEEVGYRRLWATVWDWKAASRRVLEKLGFRETSEIEPGDHGVSLLTVLEL